MTKYTGPIKEVEVVEKVKLTEKQAYEFESFKTLRNSLEEWARDKNDPNAVYSIIHELSFDEMARAYLIGYEIEPEQPKFQQRDRVIHINPYNSEDWTQQFLIDVVITAGENQLVLEENGVFKANYLRHATPEEIFWLETLGREKVGDFRVGDAITTSEDNEVCRVIDKDDSYDSSIVSLASAEKWHASGLVTGIYPAKSFFPFKKEQSNAHHR